MEDGETPDPQSNEPQTPAPAMGGGVDYEALYKQEKARADREARAREKANTESAGRRKRIDELEAQIGDRDGLASELDDLKSTNKELARLAEIGASAQKRAKGQVEAFLAKEDVPDDVKARIEARKGDPLDALDLIELFEGARGTQSEPPPEPAPPGTGAGPGSGDGQPLDPSQMSRAEARAFMRDPEKRREWERSVGIKDRRGETDIFGRPLEV